MNNLPALDNDAAMRDMDAEFETPTGMRGEAATPAAPVRPSTEFIIPGGRVQAHCTDHIGLVGLTVSVPRSFWSPADLVGHSAARFSCNVVAECAREFCHPDGERAITYLLESQGQHFPIKRASLIAACLTAAQRASLQLA